MDEGGLAGILNDVARCAAELAAERAAPGPLDEFGAFVRLDPLLASLHKQYLDAKGDRARAAAEYGAQGGMTDLAMLAEDSAWCAMQTRYLELRASQDAMKRAGNLMAQAKAQAERERENRGRSELLDLAAAVRTARRCRYDESALIFAWLLLCFEDRLIVTFRAPPSVSFNRLAA